MGKKLKIILAVFWIFLCALLGLFSPSIPFVKELFEIKTVNVKGTDKFTEQDIRRIFEKENWFFLDKKKIKSQLKKFNFVKNVEINRLFVGNLDLIVLERKPFAYIYYKRKRYLIDEEGVALSPKYYKINKNQKLPVLIYNDKSIDKNKLKKVALIKESFKDLLDVKKFYINKSQIACLTSDNRNIIFSIEDIDKSIQRAKIFIKKVGIKNFKYLNFSFESMVVVRR
ncbi:cell division protein FtsQ [Persephonella hydrogeniphila]|uniref:Cell division protein FtsQ n=1 Tax=Persephonella hydrogeniphila TaxID=198703 RepID=A0A285N2W1_9AQUI|nr:FtsQ-type POTRA domain-containing protein [Persephonella hydrogeniphila]SNZ02356.1 cell division protein FtsQ [Persephonella hydrogeniphila]